MVIKILSDVWAVCQFNFDQLYLKLKVNFFLHILGIVLFQVHYIIFFLLNYAEPRGNLWEARQHLFVNQTNIFEIFSYDLHICTRF